MEECATSFEQLKHLLTSDLVLKIADSYKEFLVCKNSCKKYLSGVLMQEGKVVFYESRNLKSTRKTM